MIAQRHLQLFMLTLMVVSFTTARLFTRCDLARVLLNNYGFPKKDLANWVCLIEAESGRNTASVGPYNGNGSRNYGLFQINSLNWCSGGPKSRNNECKVPCRSLINDDISDDAKCAKYIYKTHNFNAWYGWTNKCKNKNVSGYITGCRL
ncbi:hypothetical protein CHUAL_012478 [Chamberlinius hualienensis]